MFLRMQLRVDEKFKEKLVVKIKIPLYNILSEAFGASGLVILDKFFFE